MPKIAAPVERNSPATAGAGAAGIVASTQCDLATKQCSPFAGDDAD
jgi:prenylated cyclic peptide (anacyclamide/piricyclamide family)